jgi:very-short-patch-repair endonuclease
VAERVPLPEVLNSGPFLYRDARELDVGEGRLRNRDLARPFRGIRVPPSVPKSPHATAAVARAVEFAPLLRPGQFFSHSTAGMLWGVPFPRFVLDDPTVHITAVRPALAPRMIGVTSHHTTDAATGISDRFGLPVSEPVATWISLAGILRFEDLVAAGDYLVLHPVFGAASERRPFSSIEALRDAADRFHGRGARAAARAALSLREGAESRPETLLRLLIARARLPEPSVNFNIRARNGGWIGRADLSWPDFRTIAEYDGDHHRIDQGQYEKDISRIDRFIDDGWRVVRVRSAGLFLDPLGTVARITRALRMGGWRPAREIALIDLGGVSQGR